MDLKSKIQKDLKTKKVYFGYKQCIKTPAKNIDYIVLAKNSPSDIQEKIKKRKLKIEDFPSDSKDLGILCGKPFHISVLTALKNPLEKKQ